MPVRNQALSFETIFIMVNNLKIQFFKNNNKHNTVQENIVKHIYCSNQNDVLYSLPITILVLLPASGKMY